MPEIYKAASHTNPVSIQSYGYPPADANNQITILAFKLDIDFSANRIDIDFKRTKRIESVADVPTMLRTIANPPAGFWRGPRKQGFRCSVGPGHHANGDYGDKVVVAIRLTSRDDWQFSSNYHPITLADGNPLNRLASHAGSMDKHGQFGANGPLPQGQHNDETILAWFQFDGSNLNNDYKVSFNLHLDLLDKNGGVIVYRLPIVIDPDVRHPDGTEP